MLWDGIKRKILEQIQNYIIPYFTDPNVITISTQTHLQLHSYLVSFVSKILTFLETLSLERKSLPSVQFSMLLFFTLWKVILTLSYVWMGVQEAIDPLIFKCVQFNNKALRLNSLIGTLLSFDDGEFLHQSITTFFQDWIAGWDEGVGLTSKTLLHWALNGLWQSHTRWWDLWWRPYQIRTGKHC